METLPDRSLTLEVAEKSHSNLADPTLYQCTFGDPDGDISVAIVGGSRIDHYVSAFDVAGTNNGWRIQTMIKSGCQFSARDGEIGGEHRDSCLAWNVSVLDALLAHPPDLLVLLGSRSFSDHKEAFLPGVAERFAQLQEHGVKGLAVRDIPRIPESWADCLATRSLDKCKFEVPSHRLTADHLQLDASIEGGPVWADFLPYVCPDGTCPATVGNVLTYYDRSHLTGTFARSLAPAAVDAVKYALDLDL